MNKDQVKQKVIKICDNAVAELYLNTSPMSVLNDIIQKCKKLQDRVHRELEGKSKDSERAPTNSEGWEG